MFSIRQTLFSIHESFPFAEVIRCPTLAALILAACCLTNVAPAQVYVTPEEAAEDPDFALQGEYTDQARGLQAIAMGEGAFNVVIYTGGLPGAGWNGTEKQTLEVDGDQLESMLKQFERVNRESPTLGVQPPAGAVILFDGTKESLEKHWKPGARITPDGLLMEGCTSIDTFGDYSMHLEFRLPFMPKARGQGRGNSGLYHQGRYETQVLDSFGLEGKNNEAGGLYSIRDPDLNMCFPPLQWQTYDVDFTAARYDEDGKKTTNAKITVKLNGVVVHRDVELPRSTTAAPVREGNQDGPIYLQNHSNPVRFRNIWVRPRDVDAEARRPIVPGFERFHAGGIDPIEGGRLLISELNCIACHKTDESVAAKLRSKQAPRLDEVGKRVKPEWIVNFISNPHQAKPGTTMPDLMSGMTPETRREAAVAITNYLVGTDTPAMASKSGNTGAGERIFHESGCVACHAPRDDRKTAVSTSVPLVDLGDKYTRGSLEEFLKNPLAARPSGRMPQMDLGGDNWRHVAQYLTGDMSVSFSSQRELPKEPNLRFSAYHRDVDQLPDLDEIEPDQIGQSRGLDIAAGGRNESVILRFDGFLPIKKAGQYTFRLASDDGSRLFIDGKRVIDNDGVHPVQERETSLRLNEGIHEIRVDWFEKSGGEELRLDWAGPGIEAGPIDKAFVLKADGWSKDSANQASSQDPESVDPDVFVYDPTKVEAGRKLFAQLGCVSCHARTEQGEPIRTTLEAPALADCNSNLGCLQNPPDASIPNYDLTSFQRDAIAAAIGSTPIPAEPSNAWHLEHTMKSLHCYACHLRDGKGGVERERNEFFTSTIPEMGDEGRLPPPLNGVGDKLKESWIKKVVSDGDKSRPYMRTHMPKFGESNAGHLAEIFASIDALGGSEQRVTDEPLNRQITLGRKMVGAKGLGCVSCHTYGQFRATGIQAIALDTMTNRIREDWFHRYLPDPQQYRPGTRMPSGYPEGKSTVTDIYQGDPTKQIASMWAYLSQGSSGGVPEGITGGMIELVPDERPVIYRNFIEGVSPRGIAVGYPEKTNLCWDADQMSLAVIWQDRFLDASRHWIGRGQGKQSPLGGNVMKYESVSPIASLENLESEWPSSPMKPRGYQFLGYRLDQQGRPTFRYRTPSATVEDKPIPIAGEFAGTLKRVIQVTPTDGGPSNGKLYFRAATGQIEKLDDGWYSVNGTLKIRTESSGASAKTRQVRGAVEVLLPIEGPTEITQEIVW